jgi:hypothetical protein
LSLVFVGSDGNRAFVSYDQGSAIQAVLSQILGRRINIASGSEGDCKDWARTLRKWIPRIRLLRNGSDYLVVLGANLREMLLAQNYYDWTDRERDFEPTWDMVQGLDERWKDVIVSFADFLDACGGIDRVR